MPRYRIAIESSKFIRNYPSIFKSLLQTSTSIVSIELSSNAAASIIARFLGKKIDINDLQPKKQQSSIPVSFDPDSKLKFATSH
jgi:hypothetical protein